MTSRPLIASIIAALFAFALVLSPITVDLDDMTLEQTKAWAKKAKKDDDEESDSDDDDDDSKGKAKGVGKAKGKGKD
jgi:Ni/Co efflux regulator RcnB